ncbi:DinB family protein [Streptomyces sp. NPDC005648]|uniref:DinB family protein n=1 Tax=Streptomyces sp. NPDC005648 TaxID=3157044 RepID=UPI0033A6EDDB
MAETHPKADLRRYLQEGRDALLWKLDGVSEYDVRRPLTPTGTNLLGLVKHLASVELGYFGDTFGRPFFGEDPPPWWYTREGADPNGDMWATADESREEIVGLYRAAWEHSDATIAALPLDATGQVPWWPEERREVTLHHILVRVITDTQRHAGHADIVRELIDGSVGYLPGKDSLPPEDRAGREEHRRRVERAARQAADG